MPAENPYVFHENRFLLPCAAISEKWINNVCVFDEWDRLIDQHTIKSGPLIIMGDLNIHIDNTTNADARRLINSVSATGIVLHVRECRLTGHLG